MVKKKHDNRAYQTEIEEAIIDYLFAEKGNPIAASPGGTGKSFVMSKLTKRFVTEWPGTTVMILAMDGKLLTQNSNELLRYWPEAPMGIYSSGLKIRDTRQPIIFGGIQSVAKRAAEFGPRNIIIVDEADQISHKEETLYQKFFYDMKQMNPNVRIIGFTATPYRLGMGCLTNMDMWDKIVIDLTKTERFNFFIENNFLAPLTTKKTKKEIDVQYIAMKGGEFDQHELQEAADTDELNKAVVEECIAYGADRNHWLVYSSGVDHGHKLVKLFMSKGISAAMLTGKDKVDYRDEVEAKFRAGEIRVLINCGLYLRGWDFPALDLIAWARATQSTSLWVQGCVRGTRIHPSKENTLILDFAGNIKRLGPINDPVIPAPRRKGEAVGESPVKECPTCFSYVAIQCRTCPDCGYIFPPPKSIQKTASSDEILKKGSKASHIAQIDDFYVQAVRYKPTLSKRGQYYLKVTYSVGTANFQESLFFDSTSSWAKKRIQTWWEHRGGKLPIPEGVDEASDRSGELLIPTVIRVDTAGQYPQVVGVDFDEDAKTSDDLTADEPF